MTARAQYIALLINLGIPNQVSSARVNTQSQIPLETSSRASFTNHQQSLQVPNSTTIDIWRQGVQANQLRILSVPESLLAGLHFVDGDDPRVMIQKELHRTFHEAFTIENGVLSTTRILAGVPAELMTWNDFENSDHWNPSWVKMEVTLTRIRGDRDRQIVLDVYNNGVCLCHLNQAIGSRYIPEGGILSLPDVLVAVCRLLQSLDIMSKEVLMVMNPISFFLRTVGQMAGKLEAEGTQVHVKSLFKSICGKTGIYSDLMLNTVYTWGMKLAKEREKEKQQQECEARQAD